MHEKFSYVGAALTGWFAKLTLTTQDIVAVIGLALSAGFTVWTFFSNRSESKKRTAEEQKRTEILAKLADKLVQDNAPPDTLNAVARIMKTSKPVKESVKDGAK